MLAKAYSAILGADFQRTGMQLCFNSQCIQVEKTEAQTTFFFNVLESKQARNLRVRLGKVM
jgi:hypothetical protein